MKKVRYILLKLLVVALLLSLSIGAGAANEEEWRKIYSQNFDSENEGNLPSENTPEITRNFSAEISGGALELKSSNECTWSLADTSSLNAASNAKGIKVLNSNEIKRSDTPKEVIGVGFFDYYCGSGDTGYFVEAIGGKNGIKMFSYYRDSAAARTNNYRFQVDEGLFADEDCNFKFEIELYVPDYDYASRYVQMLYYDSSGKAYVKKLEESVIKDNTDKWYTWELTLNNACLSKYIAEGSMKKSFSISIPGFSSTLESSAYIHSIKIKRVETSAPEFKNTDKSKTAILPVGGEEDYGSTSLSFDVTLPNNVNYTDTENYNTGTNAMTISIANEEKQDVATLQIDSVDNVQTLYAVSEESGGERSKTKLYEGNILGKTLTCTLTLDMKTKTYTVKVMNGETTLINGESSYPVNNNSSGAVGVIGRYLSVKHNPRSWAIMSVIDNVTFDILDSVEYLGCKADSDAIELDIPENGIVEVDTLTLPTEGDYSTISWISKNTDLVTISEDGGTAVLKHGEEDEEIILISTTTCNVDDNIKIMREFTFTVAEHSDHKKAEEEAAAVTLVAPDGKYAQDFTLPIKGTLYVEAVISWISKNTDVIEIDGAQASVECGEADVPVTLVATVTIGDFSVKKEVKVVVAEHPDHKKAVEEARSITLDVPQTMRVKKDFSLPKNKYIISWVSNKATITISEDGKTAVVTRGSADVIVTLTATVEVGGFSAVREFELTVPSIADLFSTVGSVQETVDTESNLLSATVDVSFPAGTGNLSFVAMSIDPVTEKIRDKKDDTRNITNTYGNVTFNIENLSKHPTDKVEYYFWSDGEISAINNAPTAISDLKTKDTVKGVKLTWAESYDDNGSMEYYAIYRNSTLVGQTLSTSYLDTGANKGTSYNYTVVPMDTNELIGGSGEAIGKSTIEMFYIKYGKNGNTVYGMEDVQFSTESNRDAYAFVTEVTDAYGEKSSAATTTTKYVLARTNKSDISSSDSNLVFEITYLDTEGKITLSYNQKMPDDVTTDTVALARKRVDITENMTGTNTWKTVVVRVDDAQFRQSSQMSLCDFGLSCSVANQMFIKEIKIIQADLYD